MRSDIGIILCTGFSNAFTDQEAMNHGIEGVALKPVSKADFSELIYNVNQKYKK